MSKPKSNLLQTLRDALTGIEQEIEEYPYLKRPDMQGDPIWIDHREAVRALKEAEEKALKEAHANK